MFIKQITIEGVEGDVELARTEDGGVLATMGNTVLCAFPADADRGVRFHNTVVIARYICGRDRRNNPLATNSMLQDICSEVERVGDFKN